METISKQASPVQQLAETMRALTVQQLAVVVQVQPETVRTWIRRGELTAVQLPGGQYRIPASEVDRLLLGQGEVGP